MSAQVANDVPGTPAAPSKATERPDTSEFGLEPRKAAVIKYLADAITKRHAFARDAAGQLRVHREGAWRTDASDLIEAEVKSILEERGRPDIWTSRLAGDVEKYLAPGLPTLWDRPPVNKISFKNGILDLDTGTLSPSSSAFLSPVQIPALYDPAAVCPDLERFVGQVLHEDTAPVFWELLGAMLAGQTSTQQAALFLGDGANGKSVALDVLAAIVGPENTESVSLHDLEGNRFAPARLHGKLANLCGDLPKERIKSGGVFKQIVGGDYVTFEEKYKKPHKFRPFTTMVFSANDLPVSSEADAAFFRRWVVLRFDRTFTPGSEIREISKPELVSRLTTQREISGAVNKALSALKRLRQQRKFTVSPSMQAIFDEWQEVTDPLAVQFEDWLSKATLTGADLWVSKTALRNAYNLDEAALGRAPLTAHRITKAVKRARPHLAETQKQREWGWQGLALRERDDVD